MRILIVEDSAVQANFLQGLLKSMGHQVRIARHGDEAWKILQEDPISLVLSDWVMPGLDGPGLCRLIRERQGGSYTYVILLTIRGCREDRMEGLRAGADDFLVKPVDAEELAARLEIARRILDIQARLERQNKQLEELASTDELTGLSNRRAYRRALEQGFTLANRQRLPLSLVFLDVDHFKSFNDEFGHPVGDEVLREVASVLKDHCREHDTIARHGGEEFAVVLIGAGQAESCEVAERLRTAVANRSWPVRPVTVSAGVATLTPDAPDTSCLIASADQALYSSKQRGRNRVTHHDGGKDRDAASRNLPRQAAGLSRPASRSLPVSSLASRTLTPPSQTR